MKRIKIFNQLSVILMVIIGMVWVGSYSAHARNLVSNTVPTEQDVNPVKPKKHTFSFPDIPVMLQTPEERLDFLVRHYWDRFDFRDTVYIHLPDVTEQALVNYLDLLNRVHPNVADKCMNHFLQEAAKEPKMLTYFVETLHSYCMDPNSPMRNEELYYPVALYLSQSKGITNLLRQKAEFDLKKIRLNRKGSVANDFVYTLASGKKGRMHQLNKEFTLLIFYNPDCQSCEEQLAFMRRSPLFTGKDFLSHVSVLAFYADVDQELWKKRQQLIPPVWMNAYDATGEVLRKGLYNLEASPSFYLLDKDKRVILKDAPIEAIEAYFTRHN